METAVGGFAVAAGNVSAGVTVDESSGIVPVTIRKIQRRMVRRSITTAELQAGFPGRSDSLENALEKPWGSVMFLAWPDTSGAGIILWLFLKILLPALVGAWAEKKGRFGIGYFLVSIVVPPLIIAIVVGALPRKDPASLTGNIAWLDNLRITLRMYIERIGRSLKSQ